MFKYYLKIAIRNLWRQKAFSLINIVGLSIGLTACFLIFLFVKFEMGYDSFHSKGSRIYRLVTDLKTPSDNLHIPITSWAFAPRIKQDLPEVEAFTRVSNGAFLMAYGNRRFQEDEVLFADSSLFQVFDFKLLKGNRETALKGNYNIVLSETAAKKYFGSEEALGKTLLLSTDKIPATVTGVMEDIPENSQIKSQILVSMSTLTQKQAPELDNQWSNFGAVSYLLLKPSVNASNLQNKFVPFLRNWIGTEMDQAQMHYTLSLEPLTDVHLYSDRNTKRSTNIKNVYIFSLIAVFILLIACINFINLTTARSTERAKEVGIRKVAGAHQNQLKAQFIGESVLFTLIAFVLTLGISALLLPFFNSLAGIQISKGIFEDPFFILIMFGASLLIGLVAGIYPALVLSSFKPVVVLKGRFSSGTKGVFLRKMLVVAQFTISIILITGTLIVYKQMQYMRNQDLGFAGDQMMIIHANSDPASAALKQSLSNMTGIQSVSLSSSAPGIGNGMAYSEVENRNGDLQVGTMAVYNVDYDFIPQYQLKLIAGRGFSPDFPADTAQGLIVNEAAAKLFGFSDPKEILGKRFKQWGKEGRIVGVIRNFHYRSLQEAIEPLSFNLNIAPQYLLNVKMSATNMPATIADIEQKWKQFIPSQPFNYQFLDETFNKQYKNEIRFEKLFLNFATLAIIISCLGLLGLATYSTLQRKKEIGVRKVLGASISGISGLLLREFMVLVLIAFVLASPIGWWGMQKWLEGFAYRTNISLMDFAFAGFLAVTIALVTVSFQAIKAAIANPVKSLRTD